ncbi:Mbov_0399 family ICE element protein [Mycoplasma sp. 392]
MKWRRLISILGVISTPGISMLSLLNVSATQLEAQPIKNVEWYGFDKTKYSKNNTVEVLKQQIQELSYADLEDTHCYGSFGLYIGDEEVCYSTLRYEREHSILVSKRILLENLTKTLNRLEQQYNAFYYALKEELSEEKISVETWNIFNLDEVSIQNKKSNIELIDEKILGIQDRILDKLKKQKIFDKDEILNLKFEVSENRKQINLYYENVTYGLKQYVVKNLKIELVPIDKEGREVEDRIKIVYSKWLDFNNGLPELREEVPQRLEVERKEENKFYGGKWLVHYPSKLYFKGLNSETENLYINDKPIEVLNADFEEQLIDLRNINDYYSKQNSEENNGENVDNPEDSKEKKNQNEYNIKILVYSDYDKQNVIYEYEKDLVVDSYASYEDFKYYAWNPSANPQQKLLLEKYKVNEKGETLLDSDNNPILNEFYDSEIDEQTGTKKQLVWLDFNNPNYHEAIREWYIELVNNQRIKDKKSLLDSKNNELEKIDKDIQDYEEALGEVSGLNSSYDEEHWQALNDIERYYSEIENLKNRRKEVLANIDKEIENSEYDFKQDYYYATNAPLETILPFHRNVIDNDMWKGVVAEAVVIPKGTLMLLDKNVDNFKVFKLAINEDKLTFEKWDNGKYIRSLPSIVSQDSYFSFSGLYLFASSSENSIDNLKLVYVTESNQPYKKFTEIVKRNWAQDFWQTEQGMYFNRYLLSLGYEANEISEFNYEMILQLYIKFLYTDYLIKNKEIVKVDFDLSNAKNYTISDFNKKYLSGNFGNFKEDFLIKNALTKYVNVTSAKLIASNAIKIDYELKTSRNDISLSEYSQVLNVEFKKDKNSEKTDKYLKTIIKLKVNEEYLTKLAQKAVNSEELANLLAKDNKENWVRLDKGEYFKYIRIGYVFDKETNKLTIIISVLKEFSKNYEVSRNFWERTLMLRNELTIKSENEKEKNQKINVFKNVGDIEININGITDTKVIKEYLVSELNKRISDLKYGIDYEINNLDKVVEKLKIVEILRVFNEKPKYYVSLELVAKKENTYGIKYIKVSNASTSIVNEEIDLANIYIDDLEINEKSIPKTLQAINNHISTFLQKENLELGKQVFIDNWKQFINNVILLKEFQIKIVGLNSNVKNSTTFKVKNSFNVSPYTTKLKIDLSAFKNIRLEFSITNKSKLRQAIIDEVVYELRKHSLELNKHYKIDYLKLNDIVQQVFLTTKGILRIESIKDISTNYINIEIVNNVSLEELKEMLENPNKHNNKNDNKTGNQNQDNKNPNEDIELNNGEESKQIEQDIKQENKIFDLSKVWIQKLVFEYSQASLLRQSILDNLKTQLKDKYNLEFKKHYQIKTNELNELVKSLLKGIGSFEAKLKIYPVENETKNEAKIIIANNVKTKPINDIEENLGIEITNTNLFNLASVELKDLHLHTNSKKEIVEAILYHIESTMDTYKLVNNKDYKLYVSWQLIATFLTSKKDSENKYIITINNVFNRSKGLTKLVVYNTTTNNLINDIDDNNIKQDNSVLKKVKQEQSRKKRLLWIIPLVVLGSITFIGLGFWIYKRHSKHGMKPS